jgi:hypothetical protein
MSRCHSALSAGSTQTENRPRVNGPAGGGGATWSSRDVIAAAAALVPRDLVRPSVHFEVA